MYARIFRFLLVALLAALLSGCSTFGSKKSDAPRETYRPKYVPRNVTSTTKLPIDVRRIVMLPIYWDRDANADFVTDLDVIMQLSLQRTGAFEVVPVSRTQMYKLFGVYQFSSVQILPDNLVSTLVSTYAADAVMFIDLTVNRPYRPISIGLRVKLVKKDDLSIIWAVDALFDSGDPAVANAALDFSGKSTFNRYPVDRSGGILQSPRAFAGFVADALFKTLPPR
jgi:hypothetical protein